jgi:hypothetical protein
MSAKDVPCVRCGRSIPKRDERVGGLCLDCSTHRTCNEKIAALEADLDLQIKLTTKTMGEQNRTLKKLAEAEALVLKWQEGYAAAQAEISLLKETLETTRRRFSVTTGEPFQFMDAEMLADEVAVLVRKGIVDSRSPVADALLNYRDPPATERSDRLAKLGIALGEVSAIAKEFDRRHEEAKVKIVALEDAFAREEEGATEKAGMLADLADILFEDERRAMDHGYEGLLDRARAVVSERRVVERVMAMGLESLSPDKFSGLSDAVDELVRTRKAFKVSGPSFQIDDVTYIVPAESAATAESVAAALREQGVDAFVDAAGVLSWRIPPGTPSRVEIAEENERGEGR